LYQLGWFSTGRDKAARELLKAVKHSIELGEVEAEIAFVYSSREPGESADSDRFLELVRGYGIPLISFSYQRFKAERGETGAGKDALPRWREEYDREVMKRLKGFHPDLCILAGYMLIVGGEMCRRYNMINLHPAAPGGPAGSWQEVIWQLIRDRAGESGVMMHLVTPELDKGPPVTYGTFSLRGEPFDRYWAEVARRPFEEIKREGEANPLFKLIRRHELAREFPLITATLRAFSRGEVSITPDKRVVDFEGRPVSGYNLTGEIDQALNPEDKANRR
jgi:phosphoribosylglycinamide formyltransferase-1